ncbi:hypothetical protein FOLKNPGA_02316 [Legionella sp. PC1000]|nr:hypothetical protein FOLKNPGA_02316 [Legionella sp. PC1000]
MKLSTPSLFYRSLLVIPTSVSEVGDLDERCDLGVYPFRHVA